MNALHDKDRRHWHTIANIVPFTAHAVAGMYRGCGIARASFAPRAICLRKNRTGPSELFAITFRQI